MLSCAACLVAQEQAGASNATNDSTARTWVYVDDEAVDPYNINYGHPVPLADDAALKREILNMTRMASEGNCTWFHPRERDHPIHFWEQRVRCYGCGRDVLLPALNGYANRGAAMIHRCCKDHDCVLSGDHSLPDAILDEIAYGCGVSSSSRVLNTNRQLAAAALPQGTHRIADRGGGCKISGVTFTVIGNVRERSAARHYLEDPNQRLFTPSSTKEIPSVRLTSVFDHVLCPKTAKMVAELNYDCTTVLDLPPITPPKIEVQHTNSMYNADDYYPEAIYLWKDTYAFREWFKKGDEPGWNQLSRHRDARCHDGKRNQDVLGV